MISSRRSSVSDIDAIAPASHADRSARARPTRRSEHLAATGIDAMKTSSRLVKRLARSIRAPVFANRRDPIRAIPAPPRAPDAPRSGLPQRCTQKFFAAKIALGDTAQRLARKRCQAVRRGLSTNFATWMKCPIRRRFYDSSRSRRAVGAMPPHLELARDRGAAATRFAMRSPPPHTRFLNPEAVFFVVL
jgi:hypothetical protein